MSRVQGGGETFGVINPMQAHACDCIGPQGGDPVCPCAMPAYQWRQQGEKAIEALAQLRAKEIAAEAAEPIAYLIREWKGGKESILCGQMFKYRKTAEEAAKRLTNHWRTCEVVPVMEVK